jgi:flagellar biogenesis protein FliO
MASAAAKKSRPILKILLIVTVVGVAILVVKKLRSSGSTPPANTDPYGADSTEK